MTYAPTAVDLSRLPSPDIVEALSFEAILSAMKADLVERWPDFDLASLEGTPAALILEACAYRELLLRERVNDAAKALLIASATGGDLDQLAAFFGVARMVITPAQGSTPAVMESDDSLRRRVQLAPEAFSMGGPRGAYIFHGLSIDSSVHDCWAWQTQPGRVEVVLAAAPGETVSDDVIAKLVDLFAFEEKTPLTDSVSVKRADDLPYDVVATLRLSRGPDPETVKAEAETALRAYAAERDRIAWEVYTVGIDAALKVGGVETVIRTSPASDVIVSDSQIARLGTVSITVEVV